jgi:hypothetical protein
LYSTVMGSAQKMLPVGDSETGKKMLERMFGELPLRNLILFSNGQFSEKMVEALLLLMNRKPIAGGARLLAALLKKG